MKFLSNIIIKIDEDSLNMLTKSVNCNLDGFRELNPNVNVSTLKIDLVDKESGIESMSLTVGSNPVRSKTSMLVGLKYRHKSNEKISQFNDKIENRVISLLNSFGEKKMMTSVLEDSATTTSQNTISARNDESLIPNLTAYLSTMQNNVEPPLRSYLLDNRRNDFFYYRQFPITKY